MNLRSVAFCTALACLATARAFAAPTAGTTLLRPSQLNPNLSKGAKSVLDSAFRSLLVGVSTTTLGTVPPRSQPPAVYITDPWTGKRVNAIDVARAAIAIQQLYYKRTGHALKASASGPTQINLDQLSSKSTTTVSYGTAHPKIAVGAPHGMGSSAPSETSIVLARAAGFTAGLGCQSQNTAADAPVDIAAQWKKIHDYRASARPDVCSLEFGGLIQQSASSVAPPMLRALSFPFGNPSTAQGTFIITPSIADTNGAFVASLDTSFWLTLLNLKQPAPLIDGAAAITIPAKGSVTSDVSIKGAAFSTTNLFESKGSYGPSDLSYGGSHQKPFQLFKLTRSWVIPLGLGTTTVTASAGVDGQADLSYNLQGDAAGLYAQVTPSLSTTADTSIEAVGVVCKCSVNASLTVQNSCSFQKTSATCNGDNVTRILGLLADIPYNGRSYAVERLYTHYAPWDYQATIEAYGHLVGGLFYFHQYIMKTDPRSLTQGFTWDSGWQVQPFPVGDLSS